MSIQLIPHEVILVSTIPACNFCEDGTPGPYDFATRMGPWANGCKDHWELYRAAPTLGTGKGQLWVTQEQIDGLPDEPEGQAELDEEFYVSLADEMNDPDVGPWNESDWDADAVEGGKRYAKANGLRWPPSTGDYDRYYERKYN